MATTELMGYQGSVYYPPEALSSAAETVQAFQSELGKVYMTLPGVLDINEAIDRSGDAPNKSLTQGCVELFDQVVRSDTNSRWYVDSKDSAALLRGLGKVEISRSSIAETSAHKVFFARLSGGHGVARVAVKPFDLEPKKALREWTNMKIAQSRGLDVFRPLGFFIGEKGYMVSQRQDDIEPMDNNDWTQVLRNPKQHPGLVEDLKKIGPALARVHHKGGFHGDPQMKNMVITQSGSVHLIDWEAATFSYVGAWRFSNEKREPTLRSKTAHDLQILFGSLARSTKNYGVGLLDGYTVLAQYQYFNEYIIKPYIEERMTLISSEDVKEDEEIQALMHLGNVENDLKEYILSDRLSTSMARTRQV